MEIINGVNKRSLVDDEINNHNLIENKKQKNTNSCETNFGLCKICSDKASGIHYGVVSCEGCKGFFKRSLDRNQGYKCTNNNNKCIINKITRNRCKHCRFAKCIKLGMSIDGIRMGRSSKFEKNSSNENCVSLVLTKNSTLNGTLVFESNNYEQNLIEKIINIKASKKLIICDFIEKTFSSSEPVELFKNFEKIYDLNLCELIQDTKTKELIHLTLLRNKVFEIYNNHIKNSHLISNIRERLRLKNFIEIQSENFDLDEMYHETGELIGNYCKWLTIYIKELPGFKELNTDDFLAIVSNGFLLSVYAHLNEFYCMNEAFLITPTKGYLMDRKFLRTILGKFNTDTILLSHFGFKSLGLTENEISLYYPFVLCNVNDNLINDKVKLTSLRNTYSNMLAYEFKLNNRNEDFIQKFREILEIMACYDEKEEILDRK